MRWDKWLMVLASLAVFSLYIFPLWKISLSAPQYPDPLGIFIHIDRLADEEPNDIRNVNILNHYVGMHPLPEDLPEFTLFPIIVGFMGVMGLLLAFWGKWKGYLVWFVTMVLLGIAGIYDFALWLYHYGHNIDPNAIMKFTDAEGNPIVYNPPIFGEKTILNFVVWSYPSTGGILLVVGIVLAGLAAYLGWHRSKVLQ